MAQVDAGLGDIEAAFYDLAKAKQQHTSLMVLLKIDGWLKPLNSDPRFKALLQRMKLS